MLLLELEEQILDVSVEGQSKLLQYFRCFHFLLMVLCTRSQTIFQRLANPWLGMVVRTVRLQGIDRQLGPT